MHENRYNTAKGIKEEEKGADFESDSLCSLSRIHHGADPGEVKPIQDYLG